MEHEQFKRLVESQHNPMLDPNPDLASRVIDPQILRLDERCDNLQKTIMTILDFQANSLKVHEKDAGIHKSIEECIKHLSAQCNQLQQQINLLEARLNRANVDI